MNTLEKIYKFDVSREPFHSDRLFDIYDCLYIIVTLILLLTVGRCLAEYFPINGDSANDMCLYAWGLTILVTWVVGFIARLRR